MRISADIGAYHMLLTARAPAAGYGREGAAAPERQHLAGDQQGRKNKSGVGDRNDHPVRHNARFYLNSSAAWKIRCPGPPATASWAPEGSGRAALLCIWGIHLTGVRFDVVGHEPLSAGARGFRVGELAVAHESGALPGPHRQLSTSESPTNAAAGTWVPAEVGAASGEPPVDKHGVGQLRWVRLFFVECYLTHS